MTAAADFKTACRDVVAVTDEAAAVDPLMRNLGNEFIMMIMIGYNVCFFSTFANADGLHKSA